MMRARPPHPFGLGIPHRRKAALYCALGVLFGSGILWLVFHYFLMRQGEFGPQPHPLEAWWLRLHGASAFLVLWFAGLLWGTHARPGLLQPRWRVSGVLILAALALLAVSGYLLYYAGDDTLRDVVRLVHWLTGLALAVPLLVHIVGIRRSKRQRQRS
jgi:hypothetical protein